MRLLIIIFFAAFCTVGQGQTGLNLSVPNTVPGLSLLSTPELSHAGPGTDILFSTVSLLFVLITGVFLHRCGKPYHNLVFGIHKWLTLLIIVLISRVLAKSLWPYMGSLEWVMLIALFLSQIGILVSGGMMRLDRQQSPMLWLHRFSAGLFLLDFSVLAYIMITNMK